jgi:hypothetical protein
VHSSGEKVPAKDDVDQLSKANLCSYVKERLKDAIGECCHLTILLKVTIWLRRLHDRNDHWAQNV